MSNNPYDRTILHQLEKPLADDINQLETNFDQTLRFFQAALFGDSDTGTPLDGFLATGLLTAAASLPNLTVTVKAGLGFQLQPSTEIAIDGVIGLNDLSTYKPIPLLADQVFTVPTAPVAPNTRIDIIEVRADRITTDPSLRQVLDELLGQFVPATINKTLAWALDSRAAVVNAPSTSTAPLSYVIGQEGNPGGAPSTTPGYIKIAEIAVGSDVTSIGTSDITDFRAILTERLVKLHWPASSGFNGSGATVQEPGGSVTIAGAAVWFMNIGAGLEAGDILVDVLTVFEKIIGGANTMDAKVEIREVDIVAETTALVGSSFASTGSVTTQKVYVLSAASVDAIFPYVWKEGSSGTIDCESLATVDRLVGAYAIVRRASIKRDN